MIVVEYRLYNDRSKKMLMSSKDKQDLYKKVSSLKDKSGHSIKSVGYDNEKNEILKDVVVYV